MADWLATDSKTFLSEFLIVPTGEMIPHLLARYTIGDRSLAGVRGSHTQVELPNHARIGLAKQVRRIANNR